MLRYAVPPYLYPGPALPAAVAAPPAEVLPPTPLGARAEDTGKCKMFYPERCASNATEQAELCTQGSCANTSIEVASAMTCSADDDFDQARNHMPAGEDHRPASVLGAPAWALSGA